MHLYMIPVIYFSWSVFYMQIMNAIPSGISQSFTDTSSFTVFFHCFSQLLSNLFVRYKSHLFFSCLPAFHVLTESGNPPASIARSICEYPLCLFLTPLPHAPRTPPHTSSLSHSTPTGSSAPEALR